ncbi:hypothetical protein A8B78_16580 [Jannaschia sp. EhC01]|nr:hypothetical protein A8B78_16580 [Jannaschia sp. EhC01]
MKALALPLLLTACVSTGAPPVAQGPVVPIRFDSGGIEAVGTGQRIDFGRDRAGVIETMTRLQGRAPTELPCDAAANSAYRWQGGPLLVFRNGAFAGWSTPDPAQSANGDTRFGQTCVPLG